MQIQPESILVWDFKVRFLNTDIKIYRYIYCTYFIFLLFLVCFCILSAFTLINVHRSPFPTALLTLVELVLCVFASTDGQHHLPQQRQGTSHLLLTHPVLHEAEVGVVGCQQPQQSRMQTWR